MMSQLRMKTRSVLVLSSLGLASIACQVALDLDSFEFDEPMMESPYVLPAGGGGASPDGMAGYANVGGSLAEPGGSTGNGGATGDPYASSGGSGPSGGSSGGMAGSAPSQAAGGTGPDGVGQGGDTGSETPAPVVPVQPGNAVSFEEDVWPIFMQCGPCHTTGRSGGQSVGSATLATALADSIRVAPRLVDRLDGGGMPPDCDTAGTAPCISLDELATVEEWIAEGTAP